MIPRSIKQNLAGLRRRERLLLFAWGLARWLGLVVALLLICAAADWLIDRDRDTPWSIRYGLFALQLVVAVGAGFVFLLLPQLRRLRDDDLALFVEDKVPSFRHRLISAVQLNRPGIDLSGMSPELIGVVTREAETQAEGLRFASLADHRRLRQGAAVIVPMLLLAALPFLAWPDLAAALLARQQLHDIDIPRSVYLESVTAEVWPAGDKVTLLYRITGPGVRDDLGGQVTVMPARQPSERFPLALVRETGQGFAEYAAELPAGSHDFEYTARLADGRTRRPSRVRFVPRPIVTEQKAWVLLPEFCGLRPDGSRYEVPQGRGDVVGIKNSAARIAIHVQKPIATAVLEILAPASLDADPTAALPPEQRARVIPMTLGARQQVAEAVFDLRPEETGYRVLVEDEYGFDNVPPPRRGLRVIAEEAPQVFLLKDTFGEGADSDLEGIPVPLGGSIRIPYVAHGPYGLAGARVLYRPLVEYTSGVEELKQKPWVALPLPEVLPNEKSGPFDPKRGVFQHTSFDQEVPFHAVPSVNPELLLGRTLGGGRSFLRTKGLVERDETGKTRPLSLKVGAKIEYCVEIFADRNDLAVQPDPNREYRDDEVRRPWSRSETRITEVVTLEQFQAWGRAVADEESRLRKLDSQQRGVFQQP
jgi:hypothetical protein